MLHVTIDYRKIEDPAPSDTPESALARWENEGGAPRAAVSPKLVKTRQPAAESPLQ